MYNILDDYYCRESENDSLVLFKMQGFITPSVPFAERRIITMTMFPLY